MTAAQTTSAGAVRPGTSWPGWLGYAPSARGPEARRARAQAAGLLEPASMVPVARCEGRARVAPVRSARPVPLRPVRSAPRRPSRV